MSKFASTICIIIALGFNALAIAGRLLGEDTADIDVLAAIWASAALVIFAVRKP